MVNWLLRLLVLCAVRGAAGGWGADSALFSRMSSCPIKHHKKGSQTNKVSILTEPTGKCLNIIVYMLIVNAPFI
jgi:hypothetical protein